MKGYQIEISKDEWIKIPIELTTNEKAIKMTIKALEIILKIGQGKYVASTKGLINKVKHYLLGYMLITDHIKQPSNCLLEAVDQLSGLGE